MTSHERLQSRIWGMAEAAANDWMRRQCANLDAHMYFYYKPGEIAFYIGEEPLTEHWVLAGPERISIGKSPRQVAQQLSDMAQTLPIMTGGGDGQ